MVVQVGTYGKILKGVHKRLKYYDNVVGTYGKILEDADKWQNIPKDLPLKEHLWCKNIFKSNNKNLKYYFVHAFT